MISIEKLDDDMKATFTLPTDVLELITDNMVKIILSVALQKKTKFTKKSKPISWISISFDQLNFI